MADKHRLWVDGRGLADESAVISDAEAHHALHVLRMRPGDRVTLFDGQGAEATGVVASVTRKDLAVTIEERRTHAPPPFDLVLLQAWIHRDKALEDLIRRGTEIGIRRFVFFEAERSERKPAPSDKWQRWAVDACKQCGRLWLPDFVCTARLDGALAYAKGVLCLLSLTEAAQPLRQALTGADTTLVVGPEGDFTAEEESAAKAAGAVPISLGRTVYRAEVAAFLAAALVQYEQGQLGKR